MNRTLETIYVDGKFLCKRPASSIGGMNLEFTAAFWVCPACAQVWAVEMPDVTPAWHFATIQPCSKHGGGSLLLHLDWNTYLDNITPERFPHQLMLREFKLWIRQNPHFLA